MRDKTTELHETGKKLGLKINIKKTKIMKVKTRKGGTVSIEGEDIEEVDQFTYLGSIMDRTGGTDADIRTRISKARQAFAMLKPVWKSTAFTENTKIQIFITNVKSVLFYGAETWRLTAGVQHQIQFFINKCTFWWPETINNKRLWERTNQGTSN
ncbi:unnamed protein product [Mytilus edulis]|uniref:DUF6451 domain-containing protein n=1 Tax=Mytilus edulis TaxID=6550 RepID=A0A8S3UNN7_MYTED|nr:unnamed protein product [Mytilus edulis]